MAENPDSGDQAEAEVVESQEEGGSSYWNLGGWVNYAKEKSKKTIDLMKKDFAEIRAAVGTDAVVALSRTVDTVKQKVTKSNIEGARDAIRTNVVRLFDDVSKKVAVVPPDDSETSSCIITEDGELKTLNALEMRVYEATLNVNTYLITPESTPEFEQWTARFDVTAHQEEMSELLNLYVSIRKFYNEIVPGKISHEEFWRNALFRFEQVRAAYLSGAHYVTIETASTSHSDVVDAQPQPSSGLQANSELSSHQVAADARVTEKETRTETAIVNAEVVTAQSVSDQTSQSNKNVGDSQSDERTDPNELEKAATKASSDNQDLDSNDDWEKCDA